MSFTVASCVSLCAFAVHNAVSELW